MIMDVETVSLEKYVKIALEETALTKAWSSGSGCDDRRS